jgi:hypothetical protein
VGVTHTEVNDRERVGQSGRWAGVGRSADSDSHRAGHDAAETATGSDIASLCIVFVGDRHDHDGVVAGVAISSTEPLGVGVYLGLQPVGDPLAITNSTGNVVFTIYEEHNENLVTRAIG